jgi:hypothetical protein
LKTEKKHHKLFNRIIVSISILFTLWGAFFIYRSSFISFDGQRYFSLFDDAMVSMRYGWNLSHGLGLVWNPGENIEGYTNLLMTWFMALATIGKTVVSSYDTVEGCLASFPPDLCLLDKHFIRFDAQPSFFFQSDV